MLLKKSCSKDDNASRSEDLYLRKTTVIAGDSIINRVFEDRLRKKTMW